MVKSNHILKSFIKLLYDYFGWKTDYLLEWLRDVTNEKPVNRALMINDCSFSHAFTNKFIRLLKKISLRFQILYLIRDDDHPPLNKKGTLLSLDLLYLMTRPDISSFGLKWGNLATANCILVIPYNSYLHHEVASSGVFVVVNVNQDYRSLSRENHIVKKYNNIKQAIDLAEVFRQFLIFN